LQKVRTIYSGSSYIDYNLAWADDWIGHLTHYERFVGRVFVNEDRFHASRLRKA